MRALASRLSYANVVSTLCLFIVLGGGAYAATKIRGKDIVNRSISGKKIKRDAIGGTAVKESALGRVPRARRADTAARADRLGGLDSSAFLRGRASVNYGRFKGGLGAARTLDTPVGRFELNCPGGVGGSDVRYRNNTAAAAEVWRTRVGPSGDTSSLFDHVPNSGLQNNKGFAFAEPQYSIIKAAQGDRFAELRAHQRFSAGTCSFDYELVTTLP